mmetsp:Transcript_27311/g.52954  ORF Transcript_27311/g.52954 Transcript_27311/m.52954 type:complete len:241 (-) Transcript_27311:224-946(-)
MSRHVPMCASPTVMPTPGGVSGILNPHTQTHTHRCVLPTHDAEQDMQNYPRRCCSSFSAAFNSSIISGYSKYEFPFGSDAKPANAIAMPRSAILMPWYRRGRQHHKQSNQQQGSIHSKMHGVLTLPAIIAGWKILTVGIPDPLTASSDSPLTRRYLEPPAVPLPFSSAVGSAATEDKNTNVLTCFESAHPNANALLVSTSTARCCSLVMLPVAVPIPRVEKPMVGLCSRQVLAVISLRRA